MSQAKLTAYIIFLFFLAIWTGAGFYNTIDTNYAWYNDPVGYVKFTRASVFPGLLPAWPILTAVLLLSTLTGLIACISYKGPARKAILSVLGTTALILIITMTWFVPALNKLFGPGSNLSEAETIALSKTWVIANVIRQLVLAALLWVGMKSLTRLRTLV